MKRIPVLVLGPALAGLLLAAGCETERPPFGAPICRAWKADVSALVAARCAECHAGPEPAGGYDLSTYLGAVALGSDGVARIKGGDADSRILTIFAADAVHSGLRGAAEESLTEWVVDCGARYLETELHAPGIMDPAQGDFHGALVAASDYDLAACTRCHGEDLQGGGAGPTTSCKTCHPDGESGCGSCHGDLLEKGAHRAHLSSPVLERPVACATCHDVPDGMLSPGHIDPAPVEVRLAGDALDPVAGKPDPTFDAATQRCDNTYCHLGSREDPAASASAPRWTDTATVTCTSCHGLPPSQHPDDRCQRCHQPSVDAQGNLTELALHLDRQVQLGDPALGCGGCHTSPEAPVPFADLDGSQDRSRVTVGAHDAHLAPRYGLRGPMACADCHVVPTDVRDPGHLDAPPVEVFPDTQPAGTLARTDDAAPAWDRQAGTCSQVYCHGAGTRLAQDQSPERLELLLWSDLSAPQIFCGSCHGAPPTTAVHAGTTRINECATCHPESVDAFGNPILTGPPEARTSEHIDGRTPQ